MNDHSKGTDGGMSVWIYRVSTNQALASTALRGEFVKVQRLWLSPKADTRLENSRVTGDLSPMQRFIQEDHLDRPWDPIWEVRSLAVCCENDIGVSATSENDQTSLSRKAEKGSKDDNDRADAIL
jgi:hypothetical protein